MRKIETVNIDEAKATLAKSNIDVYATPDEKDVVVNFFIRENRTDDDGYPIGHHIGFIRIPLKDIDNIVEIFHDKYPHYLL